MCSAKLDICKSEGNYRQKILGDFKLYRKILNC